MVLSFWALCSMLLLVPGPDWAYTISASMRHRSVVPTVAGLMLGYVGLTVAVAAGLGALLQAAPALLSWLMIGGAGYLAWMGISTMVRPSPVPSGEATHPSAGSLWQQVFRASGVSGVNPKALLLFLAILPQFTDPSGAWPVHAQLALLGIVHTLTCGVIYLAVGRTANMLLSARPQAARWVGRISGAAMLSIAAILLAETLSQML